MIEEYCQRFEGTFQNKMQAMSYPTKFAMIELIHEKIGDNKFRCIQQYYVDKRPYRKSVITLENDDLGILIKNYKEDEEGNLNYLPGCDILVEKIGDEFIGKNYCKECHVNWNHTKTYLMTESILGDGYYKVIDRGYDINNDEQIWGSFNGHFEFVKESPL